MYWKRPEIESTLYLGDYDYYVEKKAEVEMIQTEWKFQLLIKQKKQVQLMTIKPRKKAKKKPVNHATNRKSRS